MPLTPEAMDRLIDEHFAHEAQDDVDGAVASLAPDARHEVIPSPMGGNRGRAHARAFYTRLFAALKGEGVRPIRRLYGENFLIDETEWTGEVLDGSVFLCDGRNGPVTFRMLHVFELDENLISNEQVWCDLAAIQRQLGCLPGQQAG